MGSFLVALAAVTGQELVGLALGAVGAGRRRAAGGAVGGGQSRHWDATDAAARGSPSNVRKVEAMSACSSSSIIFMADAPGKGATSS